MPNRSQKPYKRFVAEVRPKLIKDNPSLTYKELSQLCALKWAEVDMKVKETLFAEFRKQETVYHQELLNYNKQLTEEQKASIEAEINAAENHFKHQKLKLQLKKVRNIEGLQPRSTIIFGF